MLSYTAVEKFASGSRGLKDNSLQFRIVTGEITEDMPKGLFIPSSGSVLFQAIHRGAIGSLWPQSAEVPAWLPNHFPLFLTDNLTGTALSILDHYYYNLKQEEWGTMTNFIFRDEEMNQLYKITNQDQYVEIRDRAEKLFHIREGEFR
ncbi:MAG: hypothetical protein ACQEUT_05970 [Bacillota bacterium]